MVVQRSFVYKKSPQSKSLHFRQGKDSSSYNKDLMIGVSCDYNPLLVKIDSSPQSLNPDTRGRLKWVLRSLVTKVKRYGTLETVTLSLPTRENFFIRRNFSILGFMVGSEQDPLLPLFQSTSLL